MMIEANVWKRYIENSFMYDENSFLGINRGCIIPVFLNIKRL